MVSGHCTTLCEHVISMRTSYFDIDFASQVDLNKLPLIHCFEIYLLFLTGSLARFCQIGTAAVTADPGRKRSENYACSENCAVNNQFNRVFP